MPKNSDSVIQQVQRLLVVVGKWTAVEVAKIEDFIKAVNVHLQAIHDSEAVLDKTAALRGIESAIENFMHLFTRPPECLGQTFDAILGLRTSLLDGEISSIGNDMPPAAGKILGKL